MVLLTAIRNIWQETRVVGIKHFEVNTLKYRWLEDYQAEKQSKELKLLKWASKN